MGWKLTSDSSGYAWTMMLVYDVGAGDGGAGDGGHDVFRCSGVVMEKFGM